MQHLYIPFNGSLKPEVTDGDILESIHPTPAVGGYPDKSILPILMTSSHLTGDGMLLPLVGQQLILQYSPLQSDLL